MPSIELIAFIILALVAVGTAVGMLASHHAVFAALFLILNFSTVAILYLLLDAPFIALSQVTVYAGAIMVLFLFVIMLLGAEQLPGEFKWSTLLPAIILGVLLLAETVYLLFQKITLNANLVSSAGESLADPAVMSRQLFTNYLLPFEVTSILLLVAMVGAIVLTKKEKKKVH
ncbi:MAG: NADH-quinone oxidoreductase subunit J [Anaerolineales bacterium]